MASVDDLLDELDAIGTGLPKTSTATTATKSQGVKHTGSSPEFGTGTKIQGAPAFEAPATLGGPASKGSRTELDDLLGDLELIGASNPIMHASSAPHSSTRTRTLTTGGPRGGARTLQCSSRGSHTTPAATGVEGPLSASPGSAMGSKGTCGAHLPPVHSSTSAKCQLLYIGGVRSPTGRCNGMNGAVCCDALRCTKCDFKVVAFAGRTWDDAVVDYLFFRNNYPDLVRLSHGMRNHEESVAYCCQCSWADADAPRIVSMHDYRWVCGGHVGLH